MSPSAAVKLAIISVAMLVSTGVVAREVRASFDVVITLHTSSKPLQASQLCTNGKAVGQVDRAVSVTCPMVVTPGARQAAELVTSGTDSTVFVTF